MDYLSNGHGAQNVQEDERAVCVVFSQQIAVRKALDVGQWDKGKFGYDSPIKAGRINGAENKYVIIQAVLAQQLF